MNHSSDSLFIYVFFFLLLSSIDSCQTIPCMLWLCICQVLKLLVETEELENICLTWPPACISQGAGEGEVLLGFRLAAQWEMFRPI